MQFFLNIAVMIAFLLYMKATSVPVPPLLIKQPPSEDIFIRPLDHQNKKYLILHCEAIAEPPARYYWKKNGKLFDSYQYDNHISQIPGKGTLKFLDFFDSDAGLYQCFARNQLGTATSNKVNVHLAYLNPFNITSPLILNGTEGQPFKLKCDPPSGKPKPKVLWLMQYNESKSETINNPRITSGPEGTLWFSYLKQKDATVDFVYVCAASSRAAYEYKLGNKFYLNVLNSDLNEMEPSLQYVTKSDQEVQYGKSIEFFCIFSGNPIPNITWIKDGSIIEYSNRTMQRKFGRSLLIKTADFNDKGVYTCEVSNGIGENKTHSIDLNILSSPYFIEQPQSVHKNEGESVELRCVTSGNPKPCIRWIYNGKSIAEVPPNPRRVIGPQSIIINNLTKNDTGNYGCKASNHLGYIYNDVYVNVISSSSKAVLEDTRITLKPYNQTVSANSTVIFKCEAVSEHNLQIEIVWLYNGKVIDFESESRFKKIGDDVLEIPEIKDDNAGTYTCKAKTSLSEDIASATLAIQNV